VVQDAVVKDQRSEVERTYREQRDRLWRALLAFTGDPDVAGDALEGGVWDGLAERAAHVVRPEAEERAVEELGEAKVPTEVLELGVGSGVVEVGEAADVGGEAGGTEAGVLGALGEGASGSLGGVGRQVLWEAEPLDAVVVAEGGDVDDLLGRTVLEDLGDEGNVHVRCGGRARQGY
jgi:hypothetical protein